MQDIVYDIPIVSQETKTHTIAVWVDNEFGVLARVIGLFSGRGYNIESLTVAPVNKEKTRSRITIVTSGTDKVIEQIKRLLDKMIPVYRVRDLTVDGPHVERELALIKVEGTPEQMVEALKVADLFRARVVDSTTESFIFEITSESAKIDEFVDLLRPLGQSECCRTGVAAMGRGKKSFEG